MAASHSRAAASNREASHTRGWSGARQADALYHHGVNATLRSLPQLGYTADARGLQLYSDAFAECLRSDSPEVRSTLRGLNDSKWRVLLKHAFGCEPAPPISLAQARTIAIDMVDALQDEALLKQVEEAKSGLAARLPEAERQHMVARA